MNNHTCIILFKYLFVYSIGSIIFINKLCNCMDVKLSIYVSEMRFQYAVTIEAYFLTIAYVYSFHACLCRLDLIASANNSLYKSTTIKAHAIHSWIRLLHIIYSVLIIQ